MSRSSARSVVPEESLSSKVEELLALAAERGRQMRNSPSSRIYLDSPRKPEIDALLKAALRESLEDEVVPASSVRAGEIDPGEVEREVAKKALVGLKLSTLREVARDAGIAASGLAEDVAARIARLYAWDAEEVARLVLSHEEEPSIEHGHVARLFPLEEAANLNEVAQRIAPMIDRYIRVGVARWFIFERMETTDEGVTVSGLYRTYRATVDDSAGEPALVPVPETHAVRVVVTAATTLDVGSQNTQAARAAARAVSAVTGLVLKGYVPFASTGAVGMRGSVHAVSLFMLDLLYTRLHEAGLYKRNLNVARFRVADEIDPPDEEAGDRPSLRAVRFEGTHLLDSAVACRLLVNEGRPLVDASLHLSFRSNDAGEESRLPIRIRIESDHIAVSAGLGTKPELSPEGHRRVIAAVRCELENGADEGQLAELVGRITVRARETEQPTSATMLAD